MVLAAHAAEKGIKRKGRERKLYIEIRSARTTDFVAEGKIMGATIPTPSQSNPGRGIYRV